MTSIDRLGFLFLLFPAALGAQAPGPARNDSLLVGRILLAEDRRDSLAPALAEGLAHADPRIHLLAERAWDRIRDPLYRTRTALPELPAPPVWPEPAWKERYRALAARKDDCAAMGTALADTEWIVRLHAADVVAPACGTDTNIVATLHRWIDRGPVDVTRHRVGQVAWHAAAHAITALARLRPADARTRLPALARARTWELRLYAARAAAILGDTALLRTFARDRDDNVKEAAIEGLSPLTGHADDAIYLTALGAAGAQAVRSAAIALKGSPDPGVPVAAEGAFERWVAQDNASAHDVRAALLELAGRPATADRPPLDEIPLPRDAVSLALGADLRLRVTMATASGGGSFVVRLRGDVAPIMAARILELVRAHYYDGLTWQRVEPDFVIQGGSPGQSEYIGFRRALRDELGAVPHRRGTIGMSTRGHDTGDAQWFVNLRDNLRLGRDYTLFGEVTAGIEVVDRILEGDQIATIRLDRPDRP